MLRPARRRLADVTLIDSQGNERKETRVVYSYPGLTIDGRRRVIFVNGDPISVKFDGDRLTAQVRQLPYKR